MTELTHQDQAQALINDPARPLIAAQRHKTWAGERGILITTHGAVIALNDDEAARLASFISGKPCIQRHPVTTPAKARFGAVDD